MHFSKFISKVTIGAVTGVILSATAANALIYNIVDVLNITSGGVLSTVFHTASSNGGAGGTILENANGVAQAPFGSNFGFYNSTTGEIAYFFGIDPTTNGIAGSKTVSGNGNILFPATAATTGSGESLGTIQATFSSSPLSGGQTVFDFEYINSLYGGGGANTFVDTGLSGGFQTAILTLWGADGGPQTDSDQPSLFTGKFFNATLGSDLRFSLVEAQDQNTNPPSVVPLPAALPLYGTGLAIMGFVGWRRKRKAAA